MSVVLQQRLVSIDARYYRLWLLAGQSGSGKARYLRRCQALLGLPMINLSLELSRRLLDLSSRARPVHVQRILDETLPEVGPVLIDNIELLFEPSLQLDPLRALQQSSRSRGLVVAWPGTFEDGYLTHAMPGHVEYRRYDPRALAEVLVDDVRTLWAEV